MPRLSVRAAVVAILTLAMALIVVVPFFAPTTLTWIGSRTPATGDVIDLYWIMFWVSVPILLIVEGGIVLSLILFRERPGHQARTFHGNPFLEFAWTLIPALIVLFLSAASFKSLDTLSSVGGADLIVDVTGRQWQWEFKYPDGLKVVTEAHIPTGKKVQFRITSVDVIHSFWIPRISGKMDAVPGRLNAIWVTAVEDGVYLGQCAEFCGLGHADMLARVVAEPEAQFAKWLDDTRRAQAERPADMVAAGKLVAEQTCVQCHSFTRGRPSVNPQAPNLSDYGAKGPLSSQLKALKERDPQWLVKWVTDAPAIKPGTLMPPWKGVLTPIQIEAVVEYLKTLK